MGRPDVNGSDGWDILLLADADDKLVPAKEHHCGAAGDERAGAEEAARREVALRTVVWLALVFLTVGGEGA